MAYKAISNRPDRQGLFPVASERGGRLCSVDKANVIDVSQAWRLTRVRAIRAFDSHQLRLSHSNVDKTPRCELVRARAIRCAAHRQLFGGNILSDWSRTLLPAASVCRFSVGSGAAGGKFFEAGCMVQARTSPAFDSGPNPWAWHYQRHVCCASGRKQRRPRKARPGWEGRASDARVGRGPSQARRSGRSGRGRVWGCQPHGVSWYAGGGALLTGPAKLKIPPSGARPDGPKRQTDRGLSTGVLPGAGGPKSTVQKKTRVSGKKQNPFPLILFLFFFSF